MKQRITLSKARVRQVRVSPRKARLVADLIRGEQVEEALRILAVNVKKSSPIFKKAIESAVYSAKEEGADVDRLHVTRVTVDMGKTLKRFIPRAQGRASSIRKRSSQLTVELGYLG